MLRISLLGLALAVLLPVCAQADEIRTRTIVEEDGTRTTEVIRETGWDTVPVVRRVSSATGYTVMPRTFVRSDVDVQGFPVNPRDGQHAWINGVRYEWDADDHEWERDED